jgi:hypothetical protein
MVISITCPSVRWSLSSSGVASAMSPDSKRTHAIHNTLICLFICSPSVAAGYAAGVYGSLWLLPAVAWCALLVVFFTYCPDE